MEVTKKTFLSAVTAIKALVVESAKVMAEAASAKDVSKDYSGKLRNMLACAVSQAHLLSAGPDTIKAAFGAAFIKQAGDSFKVRLSEANRVRKNHPEYGTLAELWSAGTDAAFDDETGGYSVAQALKDVAKPADPTALIVKAVTGALKAGLTDAEVSKLVSVTIKQYQVEQEFLSEAEDDEAQQIAA